jgi:addiction module RelB/DinJ family antitoxin
MQTSSSLHVRMPKKLRIDAEKVMKANGMDVSSAVRLFFLHIVQKRTIPLQFITVNGLPDSFEDELCEMVHDQKNIIGPFTSSKKTLKALYED